METLLHLQEESGHDPVVGLEYSKSDLMGSAYQLSSLQIMTM